MNCGGDIRPTGFREEIGKHSGHKIHTIRAYTKGYKRRWKPGHRIDFWMGNPRNRHTCKWMEPFNPAYTVAEKWTTRSGDPVQVFGTPEYYHPPIYNDPDGAAPVCTATEDIIIMIDQPDSQTDIKIKIGGAPFILCHMKAEHWEIVGPPEDVKRLKELAYNDGFDYLAFFIQYFRTAIKAHNLPYFKGQIVHWTKHRYHEPTAQTEENPHQEAEVFKAIIENAKEKRKPHRRKARFVSTSELSFPMDL